MVRIAGLNIGYNQLWTVNYIGLMVKTAFGISHTIRVMNSPSLSYLSIKTSPETPILVQQRIWLYSVLVSTNYVRYISLG